MNKGQTVFSQIIDFLIGIRGKVSRSTLADANETRDWRVYSDFAQVLIHEARRLYAEDDFGLELKDTVYALDSSTIDLCLSAFPWARFRKTKAAVKLHTLLDLRGDIPTFIWITDGKVHDLNVLDHLVPEPGAIYVMDRAYNLCHGSSLFGFSATTSNAPMLGNICDTFQDQHGALP